jgi:hypothetical protein
VSDSYDKGGWIPGPPTLVRIEPDECVLDRNLICRRPPIACRLEIIRATR